LYSRNLPNVLHYLRKIPFVWPLLRRVSYALMPAGKCTWVTVRDGLGKGLQLYLDPRYEANIHNGHAEQAVQDALNTSLRPGMIFYDVGAHLGFFSVVAARIIGTEGKVFAFEANPDVAQRIILNRNRNNFHHIYVIPRAVCHTNAGVQFGRALQQTTGGTSSMALAAAEQGDDIISVASIRLDDFAQTNPPPDIIKMDIEGAEIEALQGASMIFSQKRPMLICEVHHQQASAFVSQFLKEHRYSWEWKDENHILAVPA
jgi:FkbM family methyltransferase